MAVSITSAELARARADEALARGRFRLDRRYATTEDGTRLVEETDPEARYFFGGPGTEIPLAEARRFGLIEQETPEAPAVEEKAQEPVEDKSAEPVEDKSRGRRR